MAQNKTRFTGASVLGYIASKANEQQRKDCKELMALLKKITRQPPKMWGPSIVGYGLYKYTYDTGYSGEAPVAGFSIRGREIVVYVMPDSDGRKMLAKLGKHRMGKSCLYFKQLADLDKAVLEKIVAGSVAGVKKRYS